MSWDPQSGAPSSAADPAGGGAQADPAELARANGATLLDALEDHRPGSREHAEATASYAFATASTRVIPVNILLKLETSCSS